MEQLNHSLPDHQEESMVTEAAFDRSVTPLLLQVRQNFGLFAFVSLIFGGAFTLLFYKAGIGLNVLFYTVIIIYLLVTVMKKLSGKRKLGTKLYMAGAGLLALSCVLTASEILIFFNIIGILLLLDLSLLHQFNKTSQWDFTKHILKMFGLPFTSLACIYMPFVDGIQFMKKIKLFRNDRLRNILIGIAISLPILYLITLLLSGADLLFAGVTKGVYATIFSGDVFFIITMILFATLACYCILCGSVSKADSIIERNFARADATIAITVMSLLSFVYFCFCALQIIYLFSGGLFQLPDGYTYAEYARGGFFELMWVTAINISLMILCRTLFMESKILNTLVVFMTACTYIMIASATYRMLLYVKVYHLTFLRLFVLLILLMEIFILIGIIVSQYKRTFPLFSYCVILVTICYTLFSFSKPDVFIASYMINHEEALSSEDWLYLTNELSLDAASVILPNLEDETHWKEETKLRGDYQYGMEEQYGMEDQYISREALQTRYYKRIHSAVEQMGIREYNFSKDRAEKELLR